MDKDEEYRQASCEGKFRADEKTARMLAKKFRGGSAYKCQFCRSWHVGRGRRYWRKRR